MPSTAPDTLEVALARGLAARLHEWDIATYVPAPDEYPDDARRPIYFGPGEPPTISEESERLLITPRPAVPVRGDIVETPMGFNYRAAAGASELEPLNVLGLLYRRLHRIRHVAFGEIRVGLVYRESAGVIGRDSRRRPGATATYMFRGLAPTVNG